MNSRAELILDNNHWVAIVNEKKEIQDFINCHSKRGEDNQYTKTYMLSNGYYCIGYDKSRRYIRVENGEINDI